jgi:hypothetical protein
MENPVTVIGPTEAAAGSARSLARLSNRQAEVRIARSLDELLMVFTIRASVYMAEQDCPFAEEFDGNDHCATHFIGFIEGEPAGCLRVRFFSDFVKLERLAVRRISGDLFSHSTWLAPESSLPGVKGLRASTAIPAKGWTLFGQDLALSPCQTGRSSSSRIIAIQKWSAISSQLPIPYR